MNTYVPISYLYNQVRVIYDCWIFSKFKVRDDMLHEPFYNQRRGRGTIIEDRKSNGIWVYGIFTQAKVLYRTEPFRE